MEVENFLTQVVYTKKLYRIVKVNSPFGISQRFILHFLLLTTVIAKRGEILRKNVLVNYIALLTLS